MGHAASKPLRLKDQLYEELRDPSYAATYLSEALTEGDETVLKVALADVIRARGVKAVAKLAGINRVTVYKTLRADTETSFTVMSALLKACGVRLDIKPEGLSKRPA